MAEAQAESSTHRERKDSGDEDKDKEKDDKTFECNICLDTAKDPVVSLCGHLFCWPCVHQWLETRPNWQLCPVCKAAISKDKLIPLYGRGNSGQEDPRNKVPPRPAGQRVEPENNGGFAGLNFADGVFQMSFGIGAFPFGLFALPFHLGENRPMAAPRGTPQFEDDQFLSKFFFGVAGLFIVWLLLL